ncbi:MAG: aldehyde ferredoxin oxidoreductase family protein [Promethearchaeota archaeon]|nr:MAG: aldehyde ferredoxin oxidoreductase family protein [Candidatus Lokiarchaeota archaeon]
MVNGYSGNILRVDLTNQETSIEHPDDVFYRRYIGGEGFVVYYLLKELKAGIDPLSPENKLIFATGPLTGYAIPGTGRNSVGAKSPLTGGFGEAEVGGHWGAELKHAGFDAIIIEGKAKNPVYLWIQDGEAEIKDANHLWGKVTGEVEALIKKELEDKFIRVAQIGPGGERLVRYACVINDLRNAAGRSGMGAVMGSKNLKAIAVRGHKKLEVHNKDKLREKIKEFNELAYKSVSGYFKHGTGGGIMEQFAKSGNLPTRNFRDGDFSGAEALDPSIMKEEINLTMEACYACSIQCKKVVNIGEPWKVDPKYGGPEYESIAAFGSNCGIDDIKAVCKANELCNKYSLDTISTGVSIGFAMECYENGILSEKDTNGIKLNFGNGEAMVQMTEMIAKREGLGDILAEGVRRAAEKIKNGAPQFAMHVKGQEIPMHEPRLKPGLGIGYAISPTGAEHMANIHDNSFANERAIPLHSAIGILEPIDMNDLSAKKVRILAYYSNWRNLYNALLICYFLPWDYVDVPEIVRSVTGWYTTTWEMMKVGERIITMARIFNIREGFSKKDDCVPQRFFQPHRSGALAETALKSEEFENAVQIYYEMMGWNNKGIPTKIKLEELDIGWLYQYL